MPVNNHWTIDVSTLPLKRINAAIPETIDYSSLDETQRRSLLQGTKQGSQILVRADAAQMPFPDEFFDLVLADLFFGSSPSAQEHQIITDVARVTKRGGQSLL